MRILLSPAKNMRVESDSLAPLSKPVFTKETAAIYQTLKDLTREELKQLWACNDKLTNENVERLKHYDANALGTPAVLAYVGLAFQYMAPGVFTDQEFAYVQEHLRILSAFYGVLKPMDGIQPYRLEMKAPLSIQGSSNLYAYWSDKLYQEVRDPDGTFLNLASKEYADAITPYLTEQDQMITVIFAQEKNGKRIQKATLAKMCRGEMVRYLAENQIQNVQDLQGFTAQGMEYAPEYSSSTELVFIQRKTTR